MKSKLIAPALIALVAIGASIGIAASGVSLEGVKCLMQAKKDANKDKSSKWKDGEVFFCCDNCLGAFEKKSKEQKLEMAAKSNHQLVATKQYEQQVCPFSGGDLNKETAIKVAGAEIAFCCENCQGKAEKLEGEKQLEALFGEAAFVKAKFKLVKHEK